MNLSSRKKFLLCLTVASFLTVCLQMRFMSFLYASVGQFSSSTFSSIPWTRLGLEARNIAISKKWVILDAISTNCSDVSSFVRRHKDWVVVIVMDDHTAVKGCRSKNCVLLPWADQERLLRRFRVGQFLTQPSRLSGYLLALSGGANVIADLECGSPCASTELFRLGDSQVRSGFYYNSSNVFNPHQHFGSSHPLDDDFTEVISNGSESNLTQQTFGNSPMYYLKDFDEAFIIQGIPQVKPSCDTTRKNNDKKERVLHFPFPSPVEVGSPALAPLQTDCILFHKDALGFLFFPPWKSKTRTELFRTYWLHALKTATFKNIQFYTSCTKTAFEDSPKYYSGFVSNIITSETNTTRQFLEMFLNHFPVNSAANASQLAEFISSFIQEQFPKERTGSISSLITAWFHDLSTLGYEVRMNGSQWDRPREQKMLRARYVFQEENWTRISKRQQTILTQKAFPAMDVLCASQGNFTPTTLSDWMEPIITDIMLIVVLNYESIFRSIIYLEYVHRKTFRYVVYCGPSIEKFQSVAQENGLHHVIFLEGLSEKWMSWYFMYQCVSQAFKLNLPVQGYLHIGDDVLLNAWNIIDFPRDQIWMPEGYTLRNISKPAKWGHWNMQNGRLAAVAAISELKNVSSSLTSPKADRVFARRFIATYRSSLSFEWLPTRAMDFFYIPAVMRTKYRQAVELFLRHKLMIEIALPVIHFGLARPEDVIYVKPASLWQKARINPWESYTVNITFLHPFKSMKEFKRDKDGKAFFCKTFLRKYDSFLRVRRKQNTL